MSAESNERLNILGRQILDAGVRGNYTDLEMLVVVTLMQNALLDYSGDPAVRALIVSIVSTEDSKMRWAYLQDLEAVVCGRAVWVQ